MRGLDFSPYRRATVGFDRLFDYLENARIGAMIDALPAEPKDDAIRAASRVTALKLWSYSLAMVIVLLDAGVLLLLKAVIG